MTDRLTILTYHRVLPAPDPLRPGDPDHSIFETQVRTLARFCNVLALDQAVTRMRAGNLPPRSVCITFDDGYADNAEQALPILKKYRIPAVFFVATGFLNGGRMFNDTVIEAVRVWPKTEMDLQDVGLGVQSVRDDDERRATIKALLAKIKYLDSSERDSVAATLASNCDGNLPSNLMMNTEQLRMLVDAGMEIGGHTVTHPILTNLDRRKAEEEIQTGRTELERLTGQEIPGFAYPNGRPGRDYGSEHVGIVRDAGFRYAVSTAVGRADRESDPWQLPRAVCWQRTPMRLLLHLLRMWRIRPEDRVDSMAAAL